MRSDTAGVGTVKEGVTWAGKHDKRVNRFKCVKTNFWKKRLRWQQFRIHKNWRLGLNKRCKREGKQLQPLRCNPASTV